MPRSVLVLLAALVLSTPSQSNAAGKYVLAFWREMGCSEVGNCGAGSPSGVRIMRVWVFDEYGFPMANVPIWRENGGEVGRTQPDGAPVDIVFLDSVPSYRLRVADAAGSASDWTPEMTVNRWPNKGYYSYEMAFMYKSDYTSPGIYDTSIIGTLNTAACFDNDAPYTKDMAYNSTSPLDWFSSTRYIGTWGEHGQTFVATGDRVMQIEFHGLVPDNGQVEWHIDVCEGGPGGRVIATKRCIRHWCQDPWCVTFGVNGAESCPVVPGQTYFVRFYCEGGMNSFYTSKNNYTSGHAYWRANSTDPWTPLENADLWAHITCMTYGNTVGTIGGVLRSSGIAVDNALVTLNPGLPGETAVYSSGGSYQLPKVSIGSYTVSVWKPGYNRVTQSNVAVNGGQKTTLNFLTLKTLTNYVTNPGFEGGESGWTKYGSPMTVNSSGSSAVYSYEGTKHISFVTSGYSAGTGGVYQRLANLCADAEYTFSAYQYTHSYSGGASNPMPSNCEVRMGVDLTGGVDPASANVQWTPWQHSHGRWTPVWLKAIATGSSATLFLEFRCQAAAEWSKAAFDAVYVTTENVRITSGPYVTDVTPVSAKISWTTDVPSTTRVDYGPTSSYGSSVSNSTPVTNHVVTLTGLTPGESCNYKLTSTASGYLNAVSSNKTFSLPADSGSIADVKTLADGENVGLLNKTVTAGSTQLKGCFYIEEPDRSGGIRVNTGEPVEAGDTVTLAGTLSTINGERVIQASGVRVTP